jgi:hypothetical protein
MEGYMHVRRIRIPSAARVMCCDDRRRRRCLRRRLNLASFARSYVASLASSRPQPRQDEREEKWSSPTQAPTPSHTMPLPLPRPASPHHDVARRLGGGSGVLAGGVRARRGDVADLAALVALRRISRMFMRTRKWPTHGAALVLRALARDVALLTAVLRCVSSGLARIGFSTIPTHCCTHVALAGTTEAAGTGTAAETTTATATARRRAVTRDVANTTAGLG